MKKHELFDFGVQTDFLTPCAILSESIDHFLANLF